MHFQGPYDALYQASGILWPSRPGRIIQHVAEAYAPGRGLDIGCGDGKNLVYLDQKGWVVDGIDISRLALDGLKKRVELASLTLKGEVWCENAVNLTVKPKIYDLVISYGLYHCLNDDDIQCVHDIAVSALKSGGLFAFAVFNDGLPVPEEHHTANLYLRPKDHIRQFLIGWKVIVLDFGEVVEEHPPIVGKHKHSLTWGLFVKP
jgi:SAM-dependent methyltransferase